MNLLRRLEQSHKVVANVRFTLPQVGRSMAWGTRHCRSR